MKKAVIFFILISILASSCGFKGKKVDLILHNAKIYSVDAAFNVFEAVAIKDGKIVDIGPERSILNKYSAEKTIDLGKKTVVPGLIDAHCHFYGYGSTILEVDLTGTKSWQECIRRVNKFAETTDNIWISGFGWDQNDWADKEYPSNKELNEIFPDRAVFLTRIDGHAAIANAKALEISSVDQNSEVTGGEITKNDEGQLTGLLVDNGMNQTIEAIPAPSEDDIKKALLSAEKACFEEGLTSVVDAGLPMSTINIIQALHNSNELKMRIYAMLNPDEATLDQMKKGHIKTDRLSARSVKLYGDGALGSRGAFLKTAYSDRDGHHGAMLHDTSLYRTWAGHCDQYDFQLNTHSIGDATSKVLFDIYSEKLKNGNDKRWRIEHAQILSPEDRHYFKDLGMIPSVQPTHATSDMYWAEERLGSERMASAYAYNSLKREIGMLALGTDFPIEKISPIHTFYAAVERKDVNNFPENGFQKEESLTRQEALKGMTIWAAIASFEELEKGSIEKGKFADFTVLDRDILEVPGDLLLDTKVTHTIVGGEIVYEK